MFFDDSLFVGSSIILLSCIPAFNLIIAALAIPWFILEKDNPISWIVAGAAISYYPCLILMPFALLYILSQLIMAAVGIFAQAVSMIAEIFIDLIVKVGDGLNNLFEENYSDFSWTV